MVIVDLGYRKIVMPREKAMTLTEILESADVYEEVYWSEAERAHRNMGQECYTYHVYPNEVHFGMQIIGDAKYQMAKLAGKPVKSL